MKKYLFQQKGLACLLVLVMLASIAGSMAGSPGIAEASGLFGLEIGSYRGLSQAVKIPVSVINAADLVSLEFKVEVAAGSAAGVNVRVEDVSRGADLPDAAQLTYSGIGSPDVKIGFYMQEGAINGDGELVVIHYAHDGLETVDGQEIVLGIIDGSISGKVGQDQQRDLDTSHLPDSIQNKIYVDLMYGDLNRDDAVTIQDAFIALRASIGDVELNEQLKRAGNVSRSPDTLAGPVTVYDALLIARYAVGLIDYFPVDPPAGASFVPYVGPGRAVVSAAIGKNVMGDFETKIGGEVTFTVKFDGIISGQGDFLIAKLVDATNSNDAANPIIESVSVKGTDEVDITMDLSSVATDNNYWLEFYHYISATKQKGRSLNRYVSVVAPQVSIDDEINFSIAKFPSPSSVEFSWKEPTAASNVRIQQKEFPAPVASSSMGSSSQSWVDSTVRGKTVTGLRSDLGYQFRLKIDGGVHAGTTTPLTVNRMVAANAAKSNNNNNNLVVDVRYAGDFANLNTDTNDTAAAAFKLGPTGNAISPNNLEGSGPDGIKLTFEGYYNDNNGGPTGTIPLRYTGCDGSDSITLDSGDARYFVTPDSINVNVPR